jgi:hypothetical protein
MFLSFPRNLSFRHKKKPHDLKLTGSYEALFKRRLSAEEARSGHSSPLHSPLYKHHDLSNLSDDKASKLATYTLPDGTKIRKWSTSNLPDETKSSKLCSIQISGVVLYLLPSTVHCTAWRMVTC